MSTDLEFIKQLEKEIAKELKKHKRALKQRKFDEIESYKDVGFSINENGYITGLNLNEIRLSPFPMTLSKFQHLKKLSLNDNGITDISFLQGLKQLTSLELRKNRITDISVLQGLKHLSSLDLGGNRITDISYLQWLRDLSSLDLSSNKIEDISFLQGLRNLTRLLLTNNKITDISALQDLNNLATLNLTNNKIRELPPEIVEMRVEINLYSDNEYDSGAIFLKGNPIGIPPLEIIRKGKEAIRIYFKSLEGEKRALNEVKVLLVGDGGAGKTSLIKRLLEKEFDCNEPQTHGININQNWVVTPGKKLIKINFWDFGGQEIMHATHQFFLSRQSLYILVLDGRKDEKTEYWLKHIQSFGSDSSVLVVLNKIDQNPAFDINRLFLKEKYKNIKGFFRISCSTGEGIEDFLNHLIDELAKIEFIHTVWAKSWFNVKTQLEKMTKDFISYEEYKELCEKEKITDKISKDTLVNYLNDLGIILHFKGFNLEETHVLDPEWITTAVYKIINSKKIAHTRGLLKLNLLGEILNKVKRTNYYYPRDKHRYIIDLMRKFQLCYDVDDETVLIPDLLAAQEPPIEFDDAAALKFIIQYDFLPRSVMPRFIVNMNSDIKDGLQWRTGAVLENKDFQASAVVKADNEEKRISINVNGRQKREYFAVILAALRHINRSFEKLETTELVPMPDDPKVIVDYEHLIRLEEEGIEYYLPGKSKKKYKVTDLLGTIGRKIESDETLQMLRTIKVTQSQRKPTEKK